jgi:transcriptional regulator with XRE-family HTH domain
MGEEKAPEGASFTTDVLAENIRAFRLLRRLEQAQVAERMNYLGQQWTRQTISDIERARRNVSAEELIGFALVLGASIEQLLDPRGPERRGTRRLALGRGDHLGTVAPQHVTALICSHKTYAEVEWKGAKLVSIDFAEGRPDLTDVGPEGPDG